jgi:UPF0716 protein FxsA
VGCLLVLAFLALPFAEFWVARRLAAEIGWDPTLGIALVVLAAGVWLARWARRSAAERLARGDNPVAAARAGFDVAALFAAEVLFWFPGLVSDVLGLLLLLPPVRDLAAARLARNIAAATPGRVRFTWTRPGGFPGGRGGFPGGADGFPGGPAGPGGFRGPGGVRPRGPIIDVEAEEVPPTDRQLPPGGAGPSDPDPDRDA